jgi:hypothetical protein
MSLITIPPRQRYELFVVTLLVGVSLFHGICNIFDLGYAGQDYSQHLALFQAATKNIRSFNHTNPPGFYVFAAYVSRSFPKQFTMEGIAGALLIVNLIGLLLWYGILRYIVFSIPLRLAAFAILTFLPVRAITSVVFAPDALTVLPMVLLVIMLVVQARKGALWIQILLGLIAGGIWCLALYTKFTFLALPFGITISVLFYLLKRQAWRSKIRFSGSLILGSILPIFFAISMYTSMLEAGSIHFTKTDRGIGMPWSAVFGVMKNDTLLLDGPEFSCGSNMNAAKKHSYLSLVHLGSFSDIWNFFQKPSQEVMSQPRPIGRCFSRQRTELSKRLTPLSLVASLPITVIAVLGIIYQLAMAVWRSFNAPTLANDIKIALVFMSIAFCAPPIMRLPYYHSVYVFGYWTPRLILPGLLGLIVLGFASIDEFLRHRHAWLSKVIFIYAIALSSCYILIL